MKGLHLDDLRWQGDRIRRGEKFMTRQEEKSITFQPFAPSLMEGELRAPCLRCDTGDINMQVMKVKPLMLRTMPARSTAFDRRMFIGARF